MCQRRLAAETPQPSVRAQEHVLRQIARVFVVADEAVAQLIHGAPVALDDQVERAGPAGQARLDQRASSRSASESAASALSFVPHGGSRPDIPLGCARAASTHKDGAIDVHTAADQENRRLNS